MVFRRLEPEVTDDLFLDRDSSLPLAIATSLVESEAAVAGEVPFSVKAEFDFLLPLHCEVSFRAAIPTFAKIPFFYNKRGYTFYMLM